MRDVDRIERIIKLTEKVWLKYPDLRLTQLIGNCFPAGDNYYREDDELETRLIEIYMIAPESQF